MNKKSIILLSGGLDSLVSLGLSIKEYNIKLALTFNYGQNSAQKEIETSKKISDYYNIEHEIVELPFLKKITNNALVGNSEDLPTENIGTVESAKAVWVPNRNGLFLNIAASYAEAKGYTHIIIGANAQEGKTFPDNTEDFIDGVNNAFKYSTKVGVKVIAPLINYNKNDIVKKALEYKIPLELTYSCYSNGEKNCGECESCKNLKNALIENGAVNYIEKLF